ncbi:MAG: sugar dehydrogenase complex small subunit [Janthinobacterium lividum]
MGEPASGKRRRMLHGMLAIATAAAAGSATLRAFAQTPAAAASTAAASTGAASAAAASGSLLDHFMAVSQALTGRTTLDPDVAARLLTAVGKEAPAFAGQLQQLAAALVQGTLDAPQEALALRILGGWYMGVVDNQVVTYEQALMFDVVSDVLVIRSYCPEKPGFWATPPQEKQS